MSVVQREALEASPLADLHTLAGALGLDGYRRLRKADLISAILARQGVEDAPPAPAAPADAAAADADGAPAEADTDSSGSGGSRARPSRRPRRRRGAAADEESSPQREEPAGAKKPREEPAGETQRTAPAAAKQGEESVVAKGVVELLANGSGFVRVDPPEPSDGDVYISAAQARRCELVSGDTVSGPVRPARRSERYPSLIRVEQINGQPADQAAHATKLEEREADFPTQLIALGDKDPTLAAIALYAPFGRGSRVLVCGRARAGKSEAIKRLAGAIAGQEELQVEVLLVGIRPEELSEWKASTIATVSGLSFGAPAGARAAALEQAIERGRRIAARGGDAVLLIDTLDGVDPGAARAAMSAGRKLRDGGSLTIIATREETLGGESTVVALDGARAAAARLPAVDGLQSGTVRAELLIGLESFAKVAEARGEL